MRRIQRATPLVILCGVALASSMMVACSRGQSASSDSAAQASSSGEASFPLEIDSCGQKVVVPKRPEKLLTIGADPLAQVAAAGAGDKVVAYSALLGMELPALPGVSASELTSDDPSTEQVLSTGADFVVANAFINTDPETLKNSSITSWVPSSVCDHLVSSSSEKVKGTVADKPVIEKIQDDLKTMGLLFGTSQTADHAAEDLAARVKAVAEQNLGQGKSVALLYYFDGNSPIGAIGNGGVPAAFTASLGLKNVFEDQKEIWISDTSWEAVLQKDPDIILFVTDMTPGMDFNKNKERLLAENGAGNLKAVKEGAFLELRYHQGIAAPLALEGLESLAKQMKQ